MHLPQEHKPVATPLSDLPADNFLSPAQRETLYALLDGCLPSISPAASPANASKLVLAMDEFEKAVDGAAEALLGPPTKEKVRAYLEYRPTEYPNFRNDCLQTLANTPQTRALGRALNLLGWVHAPDGVHDLDGGLTWVPGRTAAACS